VPFSFSSGKLPNNVQLTSKWFDEATILRLGQVIESATDAPHFGNSKCGVHNEAELNRARIVSYATLRALESG
jgi:hypothetical protein